MGPVGTDNIHLNFSEHNGGKKGQGHHRHRDNSPENNVMSAVSGGHLTMGDLNKMNPTNVNLNQLNNMNVNNLSGLNNMNAMNTMNNLSNVNNLEDIKEMVTG